MRWRPWLWLCLSLICFLGAVYFWRLGDQWAQKKTVPSSQSTNQSKPPEPATPKPLGQAHSAPIRLLSEAGSLNSWPVASSSKTNKADRFKYRLSNTSKSVGELSRSDHAILLENALFDTTRPTSLPIPEQLRAEGDPGSYIVQAQGPVDASFRALLKSAGASVVSYIPNNAYLVRASAAIAQQLEASPQTAAVLPYEPYYKVKALDWAVEQRPLPENAVLNLVLFADAREATLDGLENLGAEILSEDRSPFGPLVQVRPPAGALSAIARLPGVQEVELSHARVLANDLSRVTVGVATDPLTDTNYLDLSGNGVLVNINDSGVDATHPDLAGQVLSDVPASSVDTNGHGTHVAGIIAGTGSKSTTVTNAIGSVNPGTNGQYRGKAPKARLFSMDLSGSDTYLQERAARTNALISNNSWTYGVAEYDIAAASYDAAVRDAVPEVSGAQPLVLVFPSGNGGAVNVFDTGVDDGGSGGLSDTVQSPGTAKNVITVGAVEQLRNVTNEVTICTAGNCVTNQPWLPSTDSSNQVAGFSSRGNVGVNLEGDFGRFKPDVVAPGTFVISTRSTQWDQGAYYNPTNLNFNTFRSQQISSNSTYPSVIFVPDNTVLLQITAFPFTPAALQINLTSPPPVSRVITGINQVSATPVSAELGDFWSFSITNLMAQDVTFDLQTLLVVTNSNGDFLDVLRTNLNDPLGGFYRYESGTSLAAGAASGTLALIQEFFNQRLRLTNSPALMKAMLINGARSLGGAYDFQVRTVLNLQGWGEIFLPTSLPGVLSNLNSQATSSSMFVFDQSPTNALATGQRHTRFFSLTPDAQSQELRVTLVWTDPPGNPAASIKLVNDLDLVVTNLDTGYVYFGNDITSGNEVNFSWDTNNSPKIDVVNNVENVYLRPTPAQPLGTNYSVTVIGHRVNVNAVSAQANDVVQDYALVVSSGDGEFPDALRLTSDPGKTATITTPNVFFITNSFPTDPDNPASGGILQHQHVGANTPLLGTNTVPFPTDANAVITLGMTNQWHFYMLSNDFNFTNASFVTFMPPDLALPRMGATNVDNPDNAARPEADIDMYVSTDPTLTNLSPVAIEAADKSVGRGGTEFVVKSNAAPGAVYYVGIKSEDQQAAEYGFLGVFSLLPPSTTDTNGNVYMRGMPVPTVIPVGTPPHPQAAVVLGIDIHPIHIRRVIVTNTFTHTLPGNLLGNLSHTRKFTVLNNHTCATDAAGNCITNIHDYIYEDNGEGNVPFSRPSDGPGSLKNFIGDEGLGVWQLTMVNNFPSGTGVVNRLLIKLEPENLSSNGVTRTVLPGTFTYDSIDVPADATNLTVCVSGNTQPVELYVRRDLVPTTTDFDYKMIIVPPGGCLPITVSDQPPLSAGRYYIGVYNPLGNTPQTIRITATIFKNPFAIAASLSTAVGPIPILDDAITYTFITNLNHSTVSGLDVGLLISDPRISDLAITLISPSGTRVLLFENRGGLSTNGLGTFSTVTNGLGLPTFAVTNMVAFYTNNFDDVVTGPYAPGSTFGGWSVLSNYVVVYPELPAPWLSNNVVVLVQGAISNNLPTTNSTSYSLSFEVTHAPYLVGTVGWWPFDGNALDRFGGFDGQTYGDVSFQTTTGKVNQAFFGDGTATRVLVPRAPELDLGRAPGFTIEGWINPISTNTSLVTTGAVVMSNGFEGLPPQMGVIAGTYIDGWLVETGDVDIVSSGSVPPDSGTNCLDLNGFITGAISTNIPTVVGGNYELDFAYTKSPFALNPSTFVANMNVSIGSQTNWLVSYGLSNNAGNPGWLHTSRVFTASSPVTKLTLTSLNSGPVGMLLDSFTVHQLSASAVFSPPGPLVEWSDLSSASPQGVQFWLSGLPGTNVPGALYANLVDTNQQSHVISTVVNAITNNGWQHVALTYDAPTLTARLYTNGFVAATRVVSATAFLPNTSGDLYFGYHPAAPPKFAAFGGGLDEFGVYERPLSDCEIAAIFSAGAAGKYSASTLTCPVTNKVQLVTPGGPLNFTFVNGLTWTNAPKWETNTISFSNPTVTTNSSPIVVSALDPNTTVDNFVLAGLFTNYINGLMNFTEDTNLALVPIKFAPAPYTLSNFPPTLIFSNDFESARQGLYNPGDTIPGTANALQIGLRNWSVTNGPVTVISNAVLDAVGTNYVALGSGAIQCTLPTKPGSRYLLTYSVRGPGAVSWWSGDIEPLSQRAWDLLGGNNGAFVNQATNSPAGIVNVNGDTTTLFFPGVINATNNLASKIELGDPANLKLTNGFTIEGWINPSSISTFTPEQVEQIFFRGDSRACHHPYWFGVERVTSDQLDLVFHIEDPTNFDCGIILETARQPIHAGQWQHVAAVFEPNVLVSTNSTSLTNELRLYVNGQQLTPQNGDSFLEDPANANVVFTEFTGRFPFAELDPAFSPGVSIGNRSRADNSEPFHGFIDELTVYGRALTGPEIAAIAASGALGKADASVPPAFSLGKVQVLLDDVQLAVSYGDNARWVTNSFDFTADRTNIVLTLQSELPGTLVDGVYLTELPAELNYLPEDSLATLNGEDAFGVWKLEIWDTRAGGNTNNLASLLDWQLNFISVPSNAPPVIHLVHGIPYTNSLAAHGTQNFVVDVPQWATNATNVLLFAADRNNPANLLPAGVLWDLTNQSPSSPVNALFLPPTTSGTTVLSTNPVPPYMIQSLPYYLTVTNPNNVAMTFAYGVWFDITTLTNCQLASNFVWQAGVPRYFQFDVPTNTVPPGASPQSVSFYLTGVSNNFTGVRSNVTVVLSQHLPLPDLSHYDYINSQPDTNDNIIMVVTNTTPFAVQTNRWYVGVFSSGADTNIPFLVEACVSPAYPTIIALTNGVPFVADINNAYVAPPGPPQRFFFWFQITNVTDAVLFEMYNLSGDADLVLQRDVPPTMEPYFDGSFRSGLNPEQIVLRTSFDVPDLRGNWYLGVYNNLSTNVAYTLRAVAQTNRMLLSAQPLVYTLSPLAPPRGELLQWNSVEGEYYFVEHKASLSQVQWDIIATVRATTPLTTYEVVDPGFYRVAQVSPLIIPTPKLFIQLWTNNMVRLYWSTNSPGFTLQFALSPLGPWTDLNLPVNVEGPNFAVYDVIGPLPRYYRLRP